MNIKTFIKPQIAALLASTLLLWASPGQALVIGAAESIFDWSTFTITLDAGMSLQPVNVQAHRTHTSARVDVGAVNGYEYDTVSVDDWTTDVNAAAAYTSGADTISQYTEIAFANTLRAHSLLNSSGSEDLHSQGTAQRDFRFSAVGDGTISFSLDFTHDTSASTDGFGKGYAIAKSVLSLNNLTNENLGLLDPDLAGDDVIDSVLTSYATSLSGQSLIDSDFGTLTVSGLFSNGDQGLFIAQALSAVRYRAPDVQTTVPEPASFALMGLGLAGLGFASRKRKQV